MLCCVCACAVSLCRSLMCCPPYQATVGLESLVACSEAGTGPALLASLLPDMRANVLK
jgi:hypothetical protein